MVATITLVNQRYSAMYGISLKVNTISQIIFEREYNQACCMYALPVYLCKILLKTIVPETDLRISLHRKRSFFCLLSSFLFSINFYPDFSIIFSMFYLFLFNYLRWGSMLQRAQSQVQQDSGIYFSFHNFSKKFIAGTLSRI